MIMCVTLFEGERRMIMKKPMAFIIAVVMLVSVLSIVKIPAMADDVEQVEIINNNDNDNIENLKYDDHIDMTDKVVEIIDAGTPTSYQVGYGVEENAVPDIAVVTMEGDTLVATGIGTATVKIDGETYEITVTAAPISLLLLIGQSNMRGSEGNADQSIVCPDGMVYATFGDDRGDTEGIMNINNATNFAASALTGEYSTININGTTDNLSYYPINSLTEAGKGTFGPDSGFAYEWVKQTGEKVWVVNAAHGGSSITSWQPNATNFKEAVLLFSACQETLRKEIAAGHFTLSHMGYFWCQGCSDYNWTAEKYVTNYLAMHDGLKFALTFDHDSNDTTVSRIFEFAGIIPVRAGHDYNDGYRENSYIDTSSYRFYESFMDLQMTGPRVAQYWMCNNPELEDIWMVCNIGEDWVWMPDDTNGVTDYFEVHYPDGRVDYTTQVAQKDVWYTPTTPKELHDSIHYNQIGYNEIGRESVRNTLIMLGEIAKPDIETTVDFLSWDGYSKVSSITASTIGESGTLVVPKVYPVWESKNVTYTLSKGFVWNYYDLLTDNDGLSGTLTSNASNQVVSIIGHNWSDWNTVSQPGPDGPGNKVRVCTECGLTQMQDIEGVWQIYDLGAHLLELPQGICHNINLWSILPHENVHFTSGKKWGNTSTPVTSITIPVNPGDRLYATSWLKAGENGHETSNGIRVTFFDNWGIAQTLGPGQSDRLFESNGGYLEAPEGAIAINIAMWYDSPDYEVYILNRDHTYTSVITAPTCTEQGYTTYTCGCGDSYVDNYLDATGHSYESYICTSCGKADPNAPIIPLLRINETTNMWEVSYDNGETWTSLNVPATGDKGEDGKDGEDGITPILRINSDTNMWEVSYDNGTTWTSLNVPATGEKGDQGIQGEKGDKGDQGEQGIQGEKGDKGDQGEQGIQGEKGEAGADGADGENGKDGADGLNGKNGENGLDGINGKDGNDANNTLVIICLVIATASLICTFILATILFKQNKMKKL